MLDKQNHQTVFVSDEDFQIKTTRQSWIVILTSSLFLIFQFVQMSLFDAIAIPLMNTFHIDAVKLGDLSSYYFLSSIIFLFVAGIVLDRCSIKRVILVTMAISIISIGLFSTVSTFELACFYRFLMGIANAFAFLAVVRLVMRWFPPQKIAFIIGVIISVGMIGGLLSQEPFTYLVEKFDWRMIMQLIAALGIFFYVLIACLVSDYPKSLTPIFQSEQAMMRQTSIRQTLTMSYCSFHNWLCGLCIALISLPVGILGGLWGVAFLMYVHDVSLIMASNITAILFMGFMIAAPLAGWISDKINRRRLPLLIGTIAALIVSVCLLLIPSPSYSTLMILFFLLGFFTGVQILGYPLIVENNSRLISTLVLSVISIAMQAAQGGFQIMFGYLLDEHMVLRIHALNIHFTSGDFYWAIWIFPIALLLAAMLIPFLRSKRS